MSNNAQLVPVPENTMIGFKAMPEASFSVQHSHPLTDWNALYPQLTLANAVGYLPNQFDRGFTRAVIYGLWSVRPLRLLVLNDASLSVPNISSTIKAQTAKDLIQRDLGTTGHLPDFDAQVPLLTELGRHGVILCLPDAENFELAVPHALFNADWFRLQELYEFTFGPHGNVQSVTLSPRSSLSPLPAVPSRDVLNDHMMLARLLSQHMEGSYEECRADSDLLSVLYSHEIRNELS